MSKLRDSIAKHVEMSEPALEWLHLLIGDWQMISDLSFADLVVWIKDHRGDYVAVAHCRPSTGVTVHYNDIVGKNAPEGLAVHLDEVRHTRRPMRVLEHRQIGPVVVREEIIPVLFEGNMIAAITRQTNLGAVRTPSRLEINYVEIADALLAMVSRGEFPERDAPTSTRRGAPRVGDGVVRLNGEGEVTYASPNALSCFHRLGVVGDLVGASLLETVAALVEEQGTVDETMPVVVAGRAPWRTDVESPGATLSLRSVPLREHGNRIGALILCRDVSELRRRERELITKDATIREIHHRVKNNLQTVAALLRLQARRVEAPEARVALSEAMRRVETIAIVHEKLSQNLDEVVDFDEMAIPVLRMAADVASPGTTVRTQFEGSFGLVPAEDATALGLVLTELVTNAVEHGLAGLERGNVVLRAHREGQGLHVSVADDGRGMPPAHENRGARSGLGTQIVQTLVGNELRGSIDWTSGPEGTGTSVDIRITLRQPRRSR